jgi:hypothetical protein
VRQHRFSACVCNRPRDTAPATLVLAAVVDMKTVQAMLRHSSITITADTSPSPPAAGQTDPP